MFELLDSVGIFFAGYDDVALFIARLVVGIVFIYFGKGKIKDLKKNAKDFEAMGFKPGWFWGTPIALLETVGSVLLILGVYVEVLGLLFALFMATGTVWKITKTDKGFPDWSYDVILLALGIVFLTMGGGSIGLM